MLNFTVFVNEFCSHVAMLQDGASSGVFCKQTSVGPACRFQNKCNKVEIALRVLLFGLKSNL